MADIKRFDWVQAPKSLGIIGFVRRMAKDKSWADVDWGPHRKRMPTWALEPLHTIPFAGGTVTDVTREREMPDG